MNIILVLQREMNHALNVENSLFAYSTKTQGAL